MHKRILNFCVIKSHEGLNIGNVVDFCMEEWALKNVMCITVDNATSNDKALAQLKKKLIKRGALVLGGETFHMRCCAHILNLIVKDGLRVIDSSIKKIRDVVKYIRSSPQRLDMFKQCAEKSDIKFTKSLQLDCPTRWNSTYLMLETAMLYQKAFDKLEDKDAKFSRDLGDDLPTEQDWKNAKIITKFLKRFYDVTCKLSGALYSTANLYSPEILKILRDLQLCETNSDPALVEMGNK